LYALDATTIDLCLSLFPCAQFRTRKSAVNHTLLDLRGSIPSVIVTGGQDYFVESVFKTSGQDLMDQSDLINVVRLVSRHRVEMSSVERCALRLQRRCRREI